MIVVRVELWSAITGEKSELARMVIDNIGTNPAGTRGDYRARALRGRSAEALEKAMCASPMNATHEGRVVNHARLGEHVWNLVAKALTCMKYGVPK